MPKRSSIIILPIVLLLFVGSSGCTSSDIGTVLEIFGGNTNGPTAGDVASQAIGGDKTGDKDKDSLLDIGGETVENVRKAKELEDAAAADLAGRELAKAQGKIDEAIALRPNDWGLHNRSAMITAEAGQDPNAARSRASDICKGYSGKSRDRCVVARNEDYENLLQASIRRQEAMGGSVRCATYLELELIYSIPPIEISLTMRNAYSERLDALRARWKQTGCVTSKNEFIRD